MTALTEHDRHVIDRTFVDGCDECQRDADAVDWLMAVRRFGLDAANAMFPES